MMFGKALPAQRVLSVLLLIAFLPTLTFLGHWGDLFDGSGAVDVLLMPTSGPAMFDVAAQQAEKAAHAQHCHTDLGSCSGQPMPAGMGLFSTREALLSPPPPHLSVLLPQPDGRLPAAAFAPPTPPPRAL